MDAKGRIAGNRRAKVEFYSEQTTMEDVAEDRPSEWRWRLVSATGRVLMQSGEAFKRRGDARGSFYAVIEILRAGKFSEQP